MYENIILLSIYAIVLIGIGVASNKKSQTVSDFFLGGRNVGPWLSAFAYGTTYFSAVIFIGYAGKIGWGFGLSAIWIGIGNALFGGLVAWMFLANRTRIITHHLGVKTMPEFFEQRYNSRPMKLISAVVIFIFLVPYSASVYMGLSYLFEQILGVNFMYCMIFMAALTAIYVFLGGYTATVWSDLVQGIIMIAGVFFMIFYIVNSDAVGGFANIVPKLTQIANAAPDHPPLVSVFGGKNWLALLSLVFLTSIGSMGLPQMIHKFYAVKDHSAVRSATAITTVFALIIGVGAYFTGALGRIVVAARPELMAQILTDGKMQFDNIMPVILKSTLPPIILAVIGILVLSASMSTLAAIVMTSASAVAIDLFDDKTKFKQQHTLSFIRILCLIFVLISFLIAATRPAYIVTLMSFSWGTISGSFIGPYIWGIYSKRITKVGAYAGFIGGFSTSILLTLFSGFNQANAPLFGALAMVVSLILPPVVSMFTKQYPSEFLKKVFVVKEEGRG